MARSGFNDPNLQEFAMGGTSVSTAGIPNVLNRGQFERTSGSRGLGM
jgi:hypothetical protein